jgi:succinate dehydrogenase/fumarate reductase flavoprotein subunit
MPVSQIPDESGLQSVWPHLVDRQKPGFIAVSRKGRRFVDESASYHEFVPGMIRASEAEGEAEVVGWIIADHRAIRRWGIGFARPWPVPKGRYVRNGYLLRAPTLRALAAAAGIDPDGLEATVREFNAHASRGVDPRFHRGTRTYDLYQGDPEVKPNPCLAPLVQAPFYAVRLYAGEIGTFAGLDTDEHARVRDAQGRVIAGLYAVGNDQVNVLPVLIRVLDRPLGRR